MADIDPLRVLLSEALNLNGVVLDLLTAEPADFLEGAGEVKFRSMFLVENTVGLNGLAAELVLGDFLFSEKFSFMSFVDRTVGLKGAVFGVLVMKVFFWSPVPVGVL